MNQNKFTFASKNSVFDWILFKFQDLNNFAQTKLAKPIKESIFVSSKNKFQVVFEAPHWKGTYVQFSGGSATCFYRLVKQNLPKQIKTLI